MRTGADYYKSQAQLKPTIYYRGEKIENRMEHPFFKWPLKTIAQIYDWNNDPRFMDILSAVSPITGERANRFAHVFASVDDVLGRQKQIRFLIEKLGSCSLMCPMLGGVNALFSTTYDVDQKNGTNYHQRFKDWLKHVHQKDLFVSMAMMDVKGDRSLPAGQQKDPDMYLHIVEERKDGVIVRGAKAHQTAPMIAEEVMAIPCDVLRDGESKFAIGFAIPSDTKGITYIMQHNPMDAYLLTADEIDMGNTRYSCQFGATALMVFDDVFVPNERIFLKGEWQFTRQLISRAGNMARLWQVGCRPALFGLLMGATQLVAEYNGVAESAHIRDKLTQMSFMTESCWGLSLAAAICAAPTPSGSYLPHGLLTNIAKHQSIHVWYELIKLATDVCGGLVVSLPSEKDLRSPEVGKYVEKYLKGVDGVPAENRMRVIRFIQSMVSSPTGAAIHHSGGPLQNQRIVMYRDTDFEHKKKAVKILTGIEDGELTDLGNTPFPKGK